MKKIILKYGKYVERHCEKIEMFFRTCLKTGVMLYILALVGFAGMFGGLAAGIYVMQNYPEIISNFSLDEIMEQLGHRLFPSARRFFMMIIPAAVIFAVIRVAVSFLPPCANRDDS